MNSRCFAGAHWFASSLFLAFVVAFAIVAQPARGADYLRDVRPILAANCFHCHGQDSERREADLRLDTPDAAIEDRGGYAAIVVGDPDKSEMILRIESDDEYTQMPPPESGHELTEEEIATLREWISEGAAYAPHWAFSRPKKPTVGESVDHFIKKRLAEQGLSLNAEADRRTLARRLSLDLRGLPPTVEEVDAFVNDTRPDAYERLVDTLLASPHTAERLAVNWLDTARYADTNGFSIDDGRYMWTYRDWVIKAFMDNLPYDAFVTKQLAGDLLPGGDEQDQLATGFLRCGMNTHEGGTLPQEYRVISIADKVDAAATTFLGLSMKCAQCHDHKYDPISQRDYYRFYALFDTTTEPGHGATNGNTKPTAMVTPPLPKAWAAGLEMRLEDLAAVLRDPPRGLAAKRSEWEGKKLADLLAASEVSNDQPAEPTDGEAEAGEVSAGDAATQAKEAKAKEAKAAALLAALQMPPVDRNDEHWDAINEAFSDDSAPMRDHYLTVKAEIHSDKSQLQQGRVSAMVMDHDPKRVTHLLERGQYDKPGEEVAPGVPGRVGLEAEVADRLGLARWLTDPAHPLTARVAVNRYWQLLFGRGLVETSEDFGVRSALPSHPELLDWLSVDLVENGWDVRRLLKQIVMSQAYRQSSRATPEALAADPTNEFLSRSLCRRLPAEFVRDNALAVAGLLDRTIGGPSVMPPQPDGLWREISHYGNLKPAFTAQAYYPSLGERRRRRSVYTYWKRTSPPPVMTAFDAPSREVCVTRRGQTTTPLQALALWNEPQFVLAARGLATRALAEGGSDAEVLDRMVRIALGRPASGLEQERLLAQLAWRQDREVDAATREDDPNEPWALVASTLISLHEFNARP